ncbi:MAG: NAD-dependent epimerase/dehydratase family protein [Nitrospinae bacterium]|nr:NAD-dependent epimerase/dehydratase family protein [Nitrospinota bacterium]
MRIGVTGASGFIGSRLVEALRQLPDVSVSPLTRKSPAAALDLSDLEPFVRDKELIFHLGGVNRGSDEEILLGNVVSTFNLLQAIKKSGNPGTRIVFASSSQVYKLDRVTAPIKESRSAEPANLYGLCKKTAEDLVRLSGLPYSVLRLSNVYGPGCRPNYNSAIATFCDRAVRRQPLTVNGDGRQGRDFIYVDDAVRALVLAGTRTPKTGAAVFNVSSGKIVALKQVLEQIRRQVPDLRVEYRPAADSGGVSYCCDNSRFRKTFGWKPRTSLAEGVRNALSWFQERVVP